MPRMTVREKLVYRLRKEQIISPVHTIERTYRSRYQMEAGVWAWFAVDTTGAMTGVGSEDTMQLCLQAVELRVRRGRHIHPATHVDAVSQEDLNKMKRRLKTCRS